MKVLLINFTDAGGGAAIAAVRLVNALNEHGIYARLGVSEKKSANPYVITLPKKKHCFVVKAFRRINSFAGKLYAPIARRIPNPFAFHTTNGILHTTNFHSDTDINWINNSEFDIVNLHWINGTVCNKDIAKIKKPIVWTMHDSWPCCGAEHHPNVSENDTRWREGYYRRNKPATTKGMDLCRKVWKQKKKYLSDKKIVFTAPSRWEQNVLKSSALFGHCGCELVPNIIDQTIFYPRDRQSVRALFGIPQNKTVIGFGAAYDIDNPKSMKGSYYLIEALQKLNNPEKYFLVIFGPASSVFTSKVSLSFFASGYLANPAILASIYSLCDIFVNPSLIESFGLTCLESIFCGVPVVAFDVGGTSDIVVHKETGYLASPYKAEELAHGIEWCVENGLLLSRNCLEKAVRDFDEKETVEKMIRIYESALR